MGELRIGCSEWIAAGLLPVIIDRLLQRHPRLAFYVARVEKLPHFQLLQNARRHEAKLQYCAFDMLTLAEHILDSKAGDFN